MAQQAPAQQEPVAPTVMLPALLQLTTGHRAQMGHGFALTDPIPTINCCPGRVSAQAGAAPRHSTLGLKQEAEELLPNAWEVFQGRQVGSVSEAQPRGFAY